jgi:putative DNA primase/helicase
LNWQNYGLGEPKTVTSATSDYRHEQDVLSDFIDDCCLFKPTATVPKHELKTAYETWCNGVGSQPISQKTFRARLIERSITEGKSGSTRYWRGIALSSSEGQQVQLGQERHMGQESTGNSSIKENTKNFSENYVPTSPFVPSEDIPSYPNEVCQICGSTHWWLRKDEWLCSRCHPDPEKVNTACRGSPPPGPNRGGDGIIA